MLARRQSDGRAPCCSAARHEAVGSNNWVVDGTLTATGKPLLANDPHLGGARPVDLVSGAHVRRRLRSDRRHAARRARGGARTQPATSPGAQPTSPPTSRISIASGSTRPDARRVPRRAGTDHGRPGNDRGEGRRPGRHQRAHHPARSARLRRDQREQRGGEESADAGASRAARVPVDRARRRRTRRSRRSCGSTKRATGTSSPRRCAIRRRRRRISSMPTSTATSATTRLATSRFARPATARSPLRAGPATPSGPAGFRSRSCRTSTIRRSTSSSPPTTGPAPPGVSASDRARISGSVSRAADYRTAARDSRTADRRRLRAHPGRHDLAARARRCCRCLLAARPAGRRRRPPGGRPAAPMERRCERRQRGAGDIPGVVPAAGAGDRRRRARAARDRGLSRDASRRSRASSRPRSTPTAAWCDNVTTPARETLRRRLITTRAARWRWRICRERLGTRHDALAMGRRAPRGVPAQGLDAVPVLRPLLSRSVPNGGDWSTVNVGPVAAIAPYEQQSIPGYRQIIDLSPANDSRFLEPSGQSGAFPVDALRRFPGGLEGRRYRKMRIDRLEIETGAIGRLRLSPR